VGTGLRTREARQSTYRPRRQFIVKEAAERADVNSAASIHWLRHAHASHAGAGN
jgi:site-specific recombinase XerD